MSLSIRAGDILAGKYRVERPLGQGGMGYVVAARHIHLGEAVAIKLLRPEMASDESLVERFMREARAASSIKNEHVVRVSDVDKLETGVPYMVMELLDGQDLEQVCRERGKLEPAEAIDYVMQACEALAEAHALGIVHRDLKPGNLFVTRKGGKPFVKVLDFGISKVVQGDGDMELTKTAVSLGTPSYMSPEQMISSRKVDRRSDVWAMGVILYRLLTGKLPFRAEGFESMGMRVLSSPPPPPRSVRPELPAGLEAVVLRCLEKDPAQRFSTVFQLAEALLPFGAGGHMVSAQSVPPASAPPPVPDSGAVVSSGRAVSFPPADPTLPALSTNSPTASPVRPRSVPPPSFGQSPLGVAALAALTLVAGIGIGVLLFEKGMPRSAASVAPSSGPDTGALLELPEAASAAAPGAQSAAASSASAAPASAASEASAHPPGQPGSR